MKIRIGVLCGCALLLLLVAAPLLAKPGVVKTRDGQSYEGDVTESGATVTVKTRNVPIVIQRTDVESIEYLGTLDEQYAQRMARLDPSDANGRVTVARWAFDQGRYDLARDALESALTIEPNHRDATTMLESVRVQVRLERAKKQADDARRTAATAPTTEPATAPATVGSTAPVRGEPRNLLSADDINAIRQFELKPTDTHVRINFSRDVKKRFATANNMRLQDFNALPQFEQLQRILQGGTADMKRDVRIVSDPSSILEYRRNVQPLLLGSCATSGCHGTAGAGGLMFYTPADSEAVTYTNFFIAQTYARQPERQQGPFGAGERRLIDRIEPANSLLLNYGLPANIAEFDHPQVNGYRPIFRNRDDSGYRRVENWIRDGLRPVKVEYDVNFTPPQRQGSERPEATEQSPATQPAPATTQTGS
ncbi:MAG TPA: hypothetical protein VGR35_08835 [Tepidisphaeraceae bacterium]|nr:hypothetical protein [Tepidisphaeraceae bacterium]